MTIDDELREAVRRVMAATAPTPADYGRVHALLDLKAARIREPLERRIRALKTET